MSISITAIIPCLTHLRLSNGTCYLAEVFCWKLHCKMKNNKVKFTIHSLSYVNERTFVTINSLTHTIIYAALQSLERGLCLVCVSLVEAHFVKCPNENAEGNARVQGKSRKFEYSCGSERIIIRWSPSDGVRNVFALIYPLQWIIFFLDVRDFLGYNCCWKTSTTNTRTWWCKSEGAVFILITVQVEKRK